MPNLQPVAQEQTASRHPIRELNDAFRRAGPGGGRDWMLTVGVLDLGPEFVTAAIGYVRAFIDFGPDNGPHGEHDFGSINLAGENLFWKIDYYDQSLRFGSPDPADAGVTRRVLTVMLASEY